MSDIKIYSIEDKDKAIEEFYKGETESNSIDQLRGKMRVIVGPERRLPLSEYSDYLVGFDGGGAESVSDALAKASNLINMNKKFNVKVSDAIGKKDDPSDRINKASGKTVETSKGEHMAEYVSKDEFKDFQNKVESDFKELRNDLKDSQHEIKLEISELNGKLSTSISDVKGELKADVAELRGELTSDIAKVRTEMADLKGELKADIKDLRSELKGDIAGVRTEMATLAGTLRDEMSDQKDVLKDEISNLSLEIQKQQTTLVMWIVGSAIGSAGVIVGILQLIPKP